MIIVGLTGGIGSGKTTVAAFFNDLGIPVYIADDEAKKLMTKSDALKLDLIDLFGKKAYKDGLLNRGYLGAKIFADKSLLTKMNKIVHPAVGAHFKDWVKNQKSPYVIKEAAIIFEHKKENDYDYIITVVSDLETRINRTIERDLRTRESIDKIITNQLSDGEKIKLSDFVIDINELEDTKKQVAQIHEILIDKASRAT